MTVRERRGGFQTRPCLFSDIVAMIPNYRIMSKFFCLIVPLFYRDHNPPHFHAEYQGQNASLISMGSFSKVKLIPEPPNHSSEKGAAAQT
jgi:hypothetical protein